MTDDADHPKNPDAAHTLGKAAESSTESYNEGSAATRPAGRKDPQATGQDARDDHNVQTR